MRAPYRYWGARQRPSPLIRNHDEASRARVSTGPYSGASLRTPLEGCQSAKILRATIWPARWEQVDLTQGLLRRAVPFTLGMRNAISLASPAPQSRTLLTATRLCALQLRISVASGLATFRTRTCAVSPPAVVYGRPITSHSPSRSPT